VATAPALFALAGLSMGGYIAFEIMRQAPQQWRSWRCSTLELERNRRSKVRKRLPNIETARNGGFRKVTDESFFFFVHPDRYGDAALKDLVRLMGEET
jgi:hypothetical protein